MTEVKVNIGDVIIQVISKDKNHKLVIGEPYKPFLVTGVIPDFVLRVHYNFFPEYQLEKKIFDSEHFWSLYSYNGRIALTAISPVFYRLCMFDLLFKSGDLYIRFNNCSSIIKNQFTISNQSLVLINPFQNPLIEVIITNIIYKKQGIVLHACGIDDNGIGILFCGKSGSGKSTLANLWKETNVNILSDERIIIRKIENCLWMYGTPWSGSAHASLPKRVRIKKIYFLKHALNNEIRELTKIESFTNIISNTFSTLYDQSGMFNTLNIIDQLLKEVSCYELGFLPTKNVLDFLRGVK